MYLFQKMDELALQYHDARKNVAEFLLTERSRAGEFSMQDIARKTFTSKPTLSRFAKKLGYRGWTDFFADFMAECQYLENHFTDVDPNIPFSENDHTSEMIEKICRIQMESLKDTIDQMDYSEIEKAGDLLLKSKKIVIFSMSPNIFLGELFKRKMESIRILVHLASSDEGGLIANSLNQDDCAVIVSYSGNNPFRVPTRYIPGLRERGVPIVGITSQGENYLRQNSDICLTISSRERLYTKIANYTTEESIQFIFNVLFSYCFSKDYKNNYEYKTKSSTALEVSRETSTAEN